MPNPDKGRIRFVDEEERGAALQWLADSYFVTVDRVLGFIILEAVEVRKAELLARRLAARKKRAVNTRNTIRRTVAKVTGQL